MWIWMTLASAVLLGLYDVSKKIALRNNGVLWILLGATVLTTVFLCPHLGAGSFNDHLKMILKAVLVSTSWISGLAALKTVPLTTVSTIKASRPVFVLIFSIVLFGERLSAGQWVGVALTFFALWLLSRSSRKEGIKFSADKGIAYMAVSVLTGSASAIYDKHIISGLEPLFIQSWSNFYVSVCLALVLLFKFATDREHFEKFHWDWTIVLIAVLITAADALYFFALKQEGAMLSIMSMVRRSSVLVSFVAGALLFKEKQIRSKAVDLLVLIAGVALLVYFS